MKKIQQIAYSFMHGTYSSERALFELIKELLSNSDNHSFISKVMQQLYFITPEPGDGE